MITNNIFKQYYRIKVTTVIQKRRNTSTKFGD